MPKNSTISEPWDWQAQPQPALAPASQTDLCEDSCSPDDPAVWQDTLIPCAAELKPWYSSGFLSAESCAVFPPL